MWVSTSCYHPMIDWRCIWKEPNRAFSQKVCGLLQRVNRKDFYRPFSVVRGFDPLPKVMVFLVGVPSPWAHFENLRQVNAPSIVLKKFTEDLRANAGNLDTKKLHLRHQIHHHNHNPKGLR